MIRLLKTVFIFVWAIILLSPSLLYAVDDLYDAPGLDSNRGTLSVADFEHVDPFTGGLTLSFEDMRLPGNGGLDLVVQRTFNSKNVCPSWMDSGGAATCAIGGQGKDSWSGLGWTMHMGKLFAKYNQSLNSIIEMPDGSRHEAYTRPDLSGYITKDYWKLDVVSGVYVLSMTDGRKITYGHFAGNTTDNQYHENYATRIEDANGNAITITYYEPDASADRIAYYAAIKSITDTAGRTTYFNLTPSLIEGRYRLSYIQRPDGEIITYNYTDVPSSQRVLLTKVQPPEGNPWQYTYNTSTSLHELTSTTTPFGGTISYVTGTSQLYWGIGYYHGYRTVIQKTTSGRDIIPGTWNFTYFQDPNSEYTVITDPCNRTIKHRFYGNDSGLVSGQMWKLGLPISKETVGEETINYTWIPSSYISTDDYNVGASVGKDLYVYVPYISTQTVTRDGKSYASTYSSYDAYGNPKTIAETGDKNRTTSKTYWYNPTKNIVQNKPLSEAVSGSFTGTFTTNYTYDTATNNSNGKGNLMQLNKYGVLTNYTYYTNGNLYTITDANGYITTNVWTYGRISKVTNPIYFISRVINPIGTIASETNGRGYITSYTYDGNLRLTGITPPVGNSTIISYPTDNSYKKQSRGGYYLYTYYDGLGRLSGTTDSKGIVSDIVYKNCGPKNYTTSNIGDTVRYDNFGRTSYATHQDGTKISYAYSGSKVTVTDEASKATVLTYNAFGSPDEKYLVSVKDPLANTTSYTLNMLGSLTKTTQGTLIRSFVYNTKNFLTSETHPESGATTYTRDNVGNMATKTDTLGLKTYTYDKLYRLTKIAYSTETVNFTYDNADNRFSMTSPYATESYTYDAANYLTKKVETIAGMIYTTQYGYDANDNLTSITYPTGLLVNYAYNTNNQVISATGFGGSISNVAYFTTGSSTGLPKSFTYSNGLTTSITYNNRNLTTRITAGTVFDIGYGYTDKKGNTMSMTDYKDTTKNQTFTYDNLNRLLTANGSWGTGAYTYDTTGNRKTKTIAGLATTYTYTTTKNQLSSTTGGEPAAFTYNTYGSVTGLTQYGNIYSLVYDLLSNLKSYKLGTSSLADFTYDGDDMRVTKVANGNTIVYHHGMDSNTLSETNSVGTRIADYIYLNGKLAAKAENSGVSYYHTDPTGTPIAITNSTGVVVWKEDYKPFGEEKSITGNVVNNKKFVGKEKDTETGLYYFGARYLKDNIGRFTSVDPVGAVDPVTGKINQTILLNPQRLNRYAYGLNNPYRFIDPDGRIPLDTIWDAGNVIYDIVTGDWKSLGADAACMLIPYVPAGITKVAKVADKAVDAAKAAKKTDKWSRAPKSLMDEMVLNSAKEGKGKRIIESLDDAEFKGMEKWSYGETSANGLRSEVHYVRDPKTKELMDFKFVHHGVDK